MGECEDEPTLDMSGTSHFGVGPDTVPGEKKILAPVSVKKRNMVPAPFPPGPGPLCPSLAHTFTLSSSPTHLHLPSFGIFLFAIYSFYIYFFELFPFCPFRQSCFRLVIYIVLLWWVWSWVLYSSVTYVLTYTDFK